MRKRLYMKKCGFLTRQTFCTCLFNAAYFCTLKGKKRCAQNTKRVFKTCFKAKCDVLIQNTMFIIVLLLNFQN